MAQRLNDTMARLEVDEQSLKRNLGSTGGAVAAEPLYLLLAKHAHPAAHEKAKQLAMQAQDSRLPLLTVIEQDQEVFANYWPKLSESEKAIIADPGKYYLGIAAQKTRAVAKRWQTALANL